MMMSIPGDPLGVIEHKLSNGLTIMMSVNKNQPRIFSNIVVKAGSKHDPSDATGLAHYMEHMLFKGTANLGTIHWDKEKKLLDKIEILFEKHRFEKNKERKKEIYKEIDQLSLEASAYVAPNEYDLLAGSIGASETNAYTWVEQTVYVNDIPSNQLEKWAILESERFSMLALRLFHTELETVYEEFNISQDSDFRKLNKKMLELLYPHHPYGTQYTMGTADHLKNPSQTRIYEFFNHYYVANNMGIILAGDFDPETAVNILEKHFSKLPQGSIPDFNFSTPIWPPNYKRAEVYGQEASFVSIAWPAPGSKSSSIYLLPLYEKILFNENCGLIDLNLNQSQKILEAGAWNWVYKDYGAIGLSGRNREGQTLQEVENLLLDQIELLKKGDFDDDLLESVVNNFELKEIKASEINKHRVHTIAQAFILDIPWSEAAFFTTSLKKYSKDILVENAQQIFNQGGIILHKIKGNDPEVLHVDKPPITSLELNTQHISDFGKNFLEIEAEPILPVFSDFSKEIKTKNITGDIPLKTVLNHQNELFRFDWVFPFGLLADRRWSIAFSCLQLCGTLKKDVAYFNKRLFGLGLDLDFLYEEQRLIITLSGLNSSFSAGLSILKELIHGIHIPETILENLIKDTLAIRENAKSQREYLLRKAMINYARYGPESPFNWQLNQAALNKITPSEIEDLIRRLFEFPSEFFYFGPMTEEQVEHLLDWNYPITQQQVSKVFTELSMDANKVYFLDFPMVQSDLILISRGTPYFNLEEYRYTDWYNEYFGYGLSSVVFREIRESRALAYSTYALYSSPGYKNKAHYMNAYVGTQPDKLGIALPEIRRLINVMPYEENAIEQCRLAILQKIASKRIESRNLLWTWEKLKHIGLKNDIHEFVYSTLIQSKPIDLLEFQKKYVADRNYTYLVLGQKKDISFSLLEEYGEVEELGIPDIIRF
jgi:predicted Zn-dependent peptidase